jgi:hypothetical protein
MSDPTVIPIMGGTIPEPWMKAFFLFVIEKMTKANIHVPIASTIKATVVVTGAL